MKPNELREAIEQIDVEFLHGVPVHLPAEAIEAILDVVIAAIPKDRDEGEPGSFNVGYNWAMDDVIKLLESAKSNTKEQE